MPVVKNNQTGDHYRNINLSVILIKQRKKREKFSSVSVANRALGQ
jgi:hypothetical protein